MKIVFDSNVYYAAVKPGSYAASWLRMSGNYQLYTSIALLEEIERKLIEKMRLPREAVAMFMERLESVTVLVHPARTIKRVLADEDDHKVLECAVEARADIIITADRGLLKLKEFEGIQIAHPSMLKYWFKQD